MPFPSEGNGLAAALSEAAALAVTRAPGQLHRVGEVHPHFGRRVRVRPKRDRHAKLRGQLHDLGTGINLLARLPQTGGGQTHRQNVLLPPLYETPEPARPAWFGVETKHF